MPARMDYRPDVSYAQAHLRLKKDRGRPSGYHCIECDGPAREWAYMGGCPDERYENGKAYSLDQSRYEPMCIACHRRHDAAGRDGRSIEVCPKGHPWAVYGGTRVKRARKTGLRYCRACNKQSSAAWRARKERVA